MATYGKIYRKLWTNPKTKRLSDNGKLLWVYCLTSPHANMIGFYTLPILYVSSDLGWSESQTKKLFTELFENGCVNRCDDTDTILIKAWFKHNKIENPNQLKKALGEMSELPSSSSLWSDFEQVIERSHEGLHKGLIKGLHKGYSKPIAITVPITEAVIKDYSSEKKELFDYWKERTGKNGTTRFTTERNKKLGDRLKDGYTVDEIRRAIDGCADSPYHMGDNDGGKQYNDIELICRNATKLESFRDMISSPQQDKSCPKCEDGVLMDEEKFCDCERGRELA